MRIHYHTENVKAFKITLFSMFYLEHFLINILVGT